jgi:hypothetical protein
MALPAGPDFACSSQKPLNDRACSLAAPSRERLRAIALAAISTACAKSPVASSVIAVQESIKRRKRLRAGHLTMRGWFANSNLKIDVLSLFLICEAKEFGLADN